MNCGHTGDFLYHNCPDDPSADGHGVHALVIATSDYSATGDAEVVFKDLAGTAVAAGQFAQWLVKDFRHPNLTPLRTVRVLLSPVKDECDYLPPKGTWNTATERNVRQALDRWKNDCNSDHANIAILYVGGHGTVTTNGAQHVFLSDANVFEDRYEMSINVSLIREFMSNCQAGSNIYIFDCCALTGTKIPYFREKCGITIVPFTGNSRLGRKYEFTISAARVGTRTFAFGAQDGTLLWWALKPLLKTAGELKRGLFTVTKERLDDQLLPTMRKRPEIVIPDGHGSVVVGQADPGGFTRPDPPPSFLISLASDPVAEGHAVTVTFSDEANGGTMQRQVNGGDSEPFELPAGCYEVVAEYRTEGRSRERSYKLAVDRTRRIFSYTGKEAP